MGEQAFTRLLVLALLQVVDEVDTGVERTVFFLRLVLEIDVLSWSWGLQAQTSLGGGHATGKAVARELRVVKRVDSASTALMSALRSNEMITKAVLTMRKAGKSPLEFLKITIEQGRVTGLTIEAGDKEGGPEMFENLAFSFNKITVEYVPQGKDGQPRGSTMFTDQWQQS